MAQSQIVNLSLVAGDSDGLLFYFLLRQLTRELSSSTFFCFAFLRVLKLRQRFQRFFGCPWQNQLVIFFLNTIYRDRYVVLPHPHESPRTDDHERYRLVRSDNQIINGADLLVLVVVDGFAENIFLRAPTRRDEFHFFLADRSD